MLWDWYMVLNTILGTVVVLVNTVEIMILGMKKNKRKTYKCFLLSLCISDCIFGLTKIIAVIIEWVFGQYIDHTYIFFSFLLL